MLDSDKNKQISFVRSDKTFQKTLLEWFKAPHVRQFYYGDGLQNTLDNIALYCEGKNNNGKYSFDHWIALLDYKPFGFLMTSPITGPYDANDSYNKWFIDNEPTFTLDLLIGPEEYLGQGLADKMIQHFILDQFSDASYFIIDPAQNNPKAIHVYKKVGFKEVDTFISDYDPIPHLMMRLSVDELKGDMKNHLGLPLQYNKLSAYYDAPNTEDSFDENAFIESILNQHQVKTVLDLTCGTGSQVLWLAKHGFKVTGSDFSPKLLAIAKKKVKKQNLNIKLIEGDMREIIAGQFDAAITIFNAIGHLTKMDFEKALKNIHRNLNDGGIYVFDIFNLNAMTKTTVTELSMDITKTINHNTIHQIQHSEIDKATGRLTSYDQFTIQAGSDQPETIKGKFTLQIYTAKELKEVLTRNGFDVLDQYGLDGETFIDESTLNILTIAKKTIHKN